MASNHSGWKVPIGSEAGLSGVVNIISGKGLDQAPDDVKKVAESHREKLIEASKIKSPGSLEPDYISTEKIDETELGRGDNSLGKDYTIQ